MKGYVMAEDIAARWDVSIRQIQTLCQADRITGVEKFGTTWAIPEDAVKPTRTAKIKPGRKPKRKIGEQALSYTDGRESSYERS
jgi:hypothetical protein